MTNIRKYRNINRLSIHYPLFKQRLVLGSTNPQTNNVAEETLDISAWQILTAISLLMPAFSLLTAPPVCFRASFTAVRTLSYCSLRTCVQRKPTTSVLSLILLTF